MTQSNDSETAADQVDVVVVGAGFAGLYALHSFREQGMSVQGFEAADDVGGVWQWNRYPGVRCDTGSLDYCYSFSKELRESWDWNSRYPEGAEIHGYLTAAVEMFDLRRHFVFATSVQRAEFDSETNCWLVWTDRGTVTRARFLVLAVGCLSEVQVPDIPGLTNFEGKIIHTARWPEPAPDLSGKSVGVIGTGSSGIQAIPRIAEVAGSLHVFQRTANYVMAAQNGPLDPAAIEMHRATFDENRELARRSGGGMVIAPPLGKAADFSPEQRDAAYEQRWAFGGSGFLATFDDIRSDEAANQTAADFVRRKIREKVLDPVTADLLCPTIMLGEKRPQFGDGYYETFNRPNVTLVDISTQQLAITPRGVTVGDRFIELDCLVCATGFDAMTGSILRIDVRGTDGISMREHWAAGPQTYLGLASHGFPNLFVLTGPGSPSVLGNVPVAIEQHVEFITALLASASSRGVTRIEATPAAEDAWSRHVDEVGSQTFIARGTSWYLGANVPGKPRRFLPYAGGYGTYRSICDDIAARGYPGFALDHDDNDHPANDHPAVVHDEPLVGSRVTTSEEA